MLFRLGHLPLEGEKFQWDRFEFEVIDMDRQRIDKVLVTQKAVKTDELEDVDESED
jgi:putative hemolysin